MTKLSISIFLGILLFNANSEAKTTKDTLDPKMEWFVDAKLGIFIHWGIYSVKGIDESWSFHNRKISWKDYMAQLEGFTAKSYDPRGWVDLIKESGARYAVLTTKHHDGVALWDTKERHYDVVDNTPAKRDLIAPFYAELRKSNIKVGAYYSLIDWSHPDYPGFLKDSGRYRVPQDTARWGRFSRFNMAQMKEISARYNPDLWWFDGDWEHSAEEWNAPAIRKMILSNNPSSILNGRLQGYGDYATPEQNFPITRPAEKAWELCMTTNNNWGYQPADNNWKTPYEVITIFADAISNGGNLLLDMGPRADGSIPAEQVHVLKELGAWNKKHGEAIFSTRPGLPQGHFYGPSTISKDSSSLYLFIPGKTTGPIVVRGLQSAIKSATVVGNDLALKPKIVGKIYWSHVPGLVYIDIPESAQDKYMTVLKLQLDGPMRLYRGKGGL